MARRSFTFRLLSPQEAAERDRKCGQRPSSRSGAQCERPPGHRGFHAGRTGRGYWKIWDRDHRPPLATFYCRHCQRQVWETTAGWRHVATGSLSCPPDGANRRYGQVAEPREAA